MRRKWAIVLALLLWGAGLPAQDRSSQDDQYDSVYPIQPRPANERVRFKGEDRKCKYFFSTTVMEPRVRFLYNDGRMEHESPNVRDVTIIIDESFASPAVSKIGQRSFELRMNAATFTAEQGCLQGVPQQQSAHAGF
jgi:hypothetical protein